MDKTHAVTVAALGALLLLAACSRPDLGPGAASFSNAVKHNVAVQTVNPEPEQVATPPSLDAQRTAIAIGRYQVDEVKPPRELRTSDVGR